MAEYQDHLPRINKVPKARHTLPKAYHLRIPNLQNIKKNYQPEV